MDIEAVQDRMARITKISGRFQEGAVMLASNKLGVFEVLDERPLSAEEASQALGAPERGVRMLLDALTAMDALVKEEGRYRNSPEADEFLVPGRPLYMGDSLRHSLGLYERFGKLSDAVLTGEPVPRKGGRRTPQQQRDFILAMANIGALSARKILPMLELRGDEKVLDVGGGPGTYLQVFCEAYPGLGGTLFDLPKTTAIAREYLEDKAGRERIEVRDGDYFVDELGTGFDAVLVSNIIHSLGPDSIRMLFGKCRTALVRGGRIFVKDFLLEPGRTKPRYGAVFALNMFLGTKEGGSYTFEEVEGWLEEAGLVPARREFLMRDSAFIEARTGV